MTIFSSGSTAQIFRFDPTSAEGSEYSIDYIRLYKMYSISGTPLVSINDPQNIPEGYVVSSNNTAEIQIVDDPKVSGNKVFKVNCTTTEANKYTYFKTIEFLENIQKNP